MTQVDPGPQDERLQRDLLSKVSRTFALTIPALPSSLERVVGNAYLLCRIADTIEDATAIDPDNMERHGERFIAVVAGQGDAEEFVREFLPCLAEHASADEKWLIECTPRVLAITASFDNEERAALTDCVTVMMRGMVAFQRKKSIAGLANLREHADYCYVVAGCVGEMLTRLFVEKLPELKPRRDELMTLALSFGQCLQMTNILKDFWEDRENGACWLPRDVFLEEGLDLADVTPGDPRFARGYRRLIGLAHAHAEAALKYTLALPARESGLRNFCLWALYMAVLGHRKILRNPAFASGTDVKIKRRSVRAVVAWCRLTARSDMALKASFAWLTRGLPDPAPGDWTPPESRTPGHGAYA
ncbi:MAG TPA: squalene/phytoene synthase family protein [Gammaproteobacteria bacterium]|nr:squalene/phytoene synthase family protein [Gammaproteobacteria bacterium]